MDKVHVKPRRTDAVSATLTNYNSLCGDEESLKSILPNNLATQNGFVSGETRNDRIEWVRYFIDLA